MRERERKEDRSTSLGGCNQVFSLFSSVIIIAIAIIVVCFIINDMIFADCIFSIFFLHFGNKAEYEIDRNSVNVQWK